MPLKSTKAKLAYQRGYYAKHRKHLQEGVKRRYRKNRLHILALAKARYRGRYRDTKLIKTYGVTRPEARRLLQIKKCELCGAKGRRMNTDHNHHTGVVRGRLCSACNRGLGLFKDSPDILKKALRYLRVRDKRTS